jgi:hypothetical protein
MSNRDQCHLLQALWLEEDQALYVLLGYNQADQRRTYQEVTTLQKQFSKAY